MKKFFSLLSLLVCISIGQVWATDATIANTDNSGTCVWTDGTATITQVKWAGSTNVNNSYATSLRVYGGHALVFDAGEGNTWKSFEYTVDTKYFGKSVSWGSSSAEITSSNYSSATAGSGTAVSANGGSATLGFTSARYAYVYNSATSSPVQLRITSFTATYETSGGNTPKTLSSVAVSGTPTKTAYNTGDEFDPAGLVVTGTYSDASTASITSGITWAYDPAQTLTKGQTSIGVTATVSGITSAEYNVTGLSVTDLVVSSWQVISPASMATGDVVILTMLKNNVYYAAPNNGGTNAPTATAVTVVGDKLAIAPAETLQWTVTVVEEGVYQFSVGDNYLKCTDTNNGVKVGTGDYNTFDINTTNEKQYLHTTETMTSAANGRYLGIYNTQDWRCYTSVNNNIKDGSLVIFKDASAAATVAKPTISGETPFLNTTNVTISIPTGATVYYTTDGSDPTDASTQYSAPFTLSAGATVKAIAKIGSDYSAVASKEFTKATVLTVAQARAAIDAGGDLTNKYVAGTISQIDSYSSQYHSIYYWISDDGTTTNQLEVYSGKGLNGADFAGISDLSLGDEVIVKGTLKKYNSTYEFDVNSQIIQLNRTIAAPTFTPDGGGFLNTLSVSIASATDGAQIRYTVDESDPTSTSTLYENPIELSVTTTIKAAAFKDEFESVIVTKTFTKGTKITVAEALAALDSSSPIANQFVYGKVSTAPTSNPSNGKLTYYISDDGTTTDQLEVYNGFGLNGAAFGAKTDLQVGDEVTVYGTLKVYNNDKEFESNNYLLEFSRKASAGLEYEETAVNKAVGDDAFINPLTNPNSVAVTYATSDDQVAEVANDGTVTIIGEGSATITASFAGNETYSAAQVSYTLTVSAASVVLTDYYEKVTSTANITDGTYLIVYEGESVAFDGGLETLDAASNTIAVDITNDKKIGVTEQTAAATFHIDVTAGTIKSASNKYIGVSSNSNGLKTSDDASTYSHTFSIDDDGNAVIAAAFDGSTMSLRYNMASNQARFRYYKDNGQQAIQLYKLHGEVVKPAAGLAWDPADDIVLTVGDEFTAPTLLNPNNIASADIAIASDNEDLATVSNGVVSLVNAATGTATITATFEGNDDYKSATVSYTITVNAAASPASGATYSKVTSTSDITDGEYLIVYEATSVAFNGALETLDAAGNTVDVVISEGKIAGNAAIDAAVFTIDVTAGTLQSASGQYIGVLSNSNGLKTSTDASTYKNTFAISDGNAVITADFEGSTTTLRYNKASDNLRFRYYKSGQQDIQLYKKESAQPVEPEPVYNFEPVRENLEVGRHYTICLEKKIVAVRGATFWGINNCSEDNLTVYLEMQQPPFDAGKPFIFHATAETLEVAYEGDAVGAPITNGALRGTFSYMDADALAAAGSNIYMMYNNALHPLGTNNHLDAHRAYLLFDALVPGTPAPGRTVRSMPMHGNVTTDIEDAETSAKPMKKLIDGQLFILCGEKLYDATGRQVK